MRRQAAAERRHVCLNRAVDVRQLGPKLALCLASQFDFVGDRHQGERGESNDAKSLEWAQQEFPPVDGA